MVLIVLACITVVSLCVCIMFVWALVCACVYDVSLYECAWICCYRVYLCLECLGPC